MDEHNLPLLRNARTALRAGRLDQAWQIYERLRADAPLDLATRGLELELLWRGGRLRDAAALATQLVAQFPLSPRVRYLAGRVAYQEARYEDAAAQLREAEALRSSAPSRRWLAKALTNAGHLDEAEPILVSLDAQGYSVALDLAWLQERRGDVPRARALIDKHLKAHPDDEYAQRAARRLAANRLDPTDVLEEVETLEELGEELPPELFEPYLRALLTKGQVTAAREFIAAREGSLRPRQALSLGWACRKLGAHDLAVRLFLAGLSSSPSNVKLLNSLEHSARLVNRLADLLPVYEALAPRAPNLYGRAKKLERTLGG